MKQIPQSLFQNGENAAYLIFEENNRFYLTGFPSTAGVVAATREKSWFLTDSRYSEAARQELGETFTVVDAKPSEANEILRELFKGAGIEILYLENRTLTYEEYLTLSADFSEFEIRKLDDRLEILRSVKSEEEISFIRAAQEIAERAFEKVTSSLRAGMSERDVSIELDYQMAKLGAERPSFDTIVAFDENASKPHWVPSHENKLKNGSVVLIDFGARYGHYCSDTTRTFCFGKPAEEFAEVYGIVLRAVENFEKFVRAGVQCNEADAYAREWISANGFGERFLHSTGHGVGLDIHEYPTVGMNCRTVLEENMVVTCEPGIYLPGKFGIRIEDLILVKADGAESLTKLGKQL